MSRVHTYLPQDRWRALARQETLPDRTSGSALFADISGFTALTEALTRQHGARRGIEELTRQVNAVYDALITQVERYGGSVLNFAGDAITCWFADPVRMADDPPPAALQALAAGVALQAAMQSFPRLALKVAVASGPARRFVVGDPGLYYLDALAGATVARTATAEHLAQKGEVLADEATLQACAAARSGAVLRGAVLTVIEWRSAETGERFALVDRSSMSGGQPLPDPERGLQIPDDAVLRPYLIPAVYERETSGLGSFLTELRPCTVLFVSFFGIDYDSDEAGEQLDGIIRKMQAIASRYEGALLQLTIGDKGSYVYINFGALSAHEDDTRRAVKAALELRQASELQLHMGITQGVMRVGAYGGRTRRTYGALGDEVNLAARLMQSAAAGEILLSGAAQKAVANHFSFEPHPPLSMKGKAEPLPVFAVSGERQAPAIRLQEPAYALPMVGRQAELYTLNDKLERTVQGKSQIIGIVAEAGMGKSRLVAEVIRAARKKGFAGYGGACQSDAINTPYQAWKSIAAAFFGVDPEQPLKKQIRLLEGEIEERAPARVNALPLLGVVLDLEIPDNDFTKMLAPKFRHSALRALLEDCLRAAAQDEPLLIVIEDLHWVDALSYDLLEELARALADSPVCFVLAYRPPQLARLKAPRLEALPNFTRIELSELTPAEAEQAIRAKLAQLYPARGGAVPFELVHKLMALSQGNPFYLEELLNFLHDRGLDPRDPADLNQIELPDSLHTLILSRIDRLSESEKTTLRVASIIGRLFHAAWLVGYYPELGELPRVKSDLEQLSILDITPLDTPEPELAYLFKHIVTHEVTYESLPFATRRRLHEQLAHYLEAQIAAGALHEAALLGALVYHYTHSDNLDKQREYLRKAGEAARQVSAFHTAVEYLARLLELTPAADPGRAALALSLAGVHINLGEFPAARAAIEQAQAAATTGADRAAALAVEAGMLTDLGDFAAAQSLLDEAVPLARAGGDPPVLCRTLVALGAVCWRVGKLDEAHAALTESLALARALDNLTLELSSLNMLGVVMDLQGDISGGERIYTETHARAMASLNNLGVVADVRQEFAAARDYFQQALALAAEIGAQRSASMYLNNLASVDIQLGQLPAARQSTRQGLALALRIGAFPAVVAALTNFAALAYAEGQSGRALELYGLARRHPAWNTEDQGEMDGKLAGWALDPAVVEAGLARGAALDWDATLRELLV